MLLLAACLSLPLRSLPRQQSSRERCGFSEADKPAAVAELRYAVHSGSNLGPTLKFCVTYSGPAQSPCLLGSSQLGN